MIISFIKILLSPIRFVLDFIHRAKGVSFATLNFIFSFSVMILRDIFFISLKYLRLHNIWNFVLRTFATFFTTTSLILLKIAHYMAYLFTPLYITFDFSSKLVAGCFELMVFFVAELYIRLALLLKSVLLNLFNITFQLLFYLSRALFEILSKSFFIILYFLYPVVALFSIISSFTVEILPVIYSVLYNFGVYFYNYIFNVVLKFIFSIFYKILGNAVFLLAQFIFRVLLFISMSTFVILETLITLVITPFLLVYDFIFKKKVRANAFERIKSYNIRAFKYSKTKILANFSVLKEVAVPEEFSTIEYGKFNRKACFEEIKKFMNSVYMIRVKSLYNLNYISCNKFVDSIQKEANQAFNRSVSKENILRPFKAPNIKKYLNDSRESSSKNKKAFLSFLGKYIGKNYTLIKGFINPRNTKPMGRLGFLYLPNELPDNARKSLIAAQNQHSENYSTLKSRLIVFFRTLMLYPSLNNAYKSRSSTEFLGIGNDNLSGNSRTNTTEEDFRSLTRLFS